MEARQDLDLSIDDVVDGVVQQAKGRKCGGETEQANGCLEHTDANSDDMLEAVRGKSVIEVYINNRWMS